MRIEFRDTNRSNFIDGLKPINGPAADTSGALAAQPSGTTSANMVIVDGSAQRPGRSQFLTRDQRPRWSIRWRRDLGRKSWIERKIKL